MINSSINTQSQTAENKKEDVDDSGSGNNNDNADIIELNAHFFNQCVNINNHATPSSSELPYGVYLSKVNNRLETIQETNSDFYESKRLAESNIGTIFRSRSSFVNDERNAFFITDNDNNNKHKGNSMLQNSNFIFKQSANYNGNILIIDAPPIISISQCKSLKQHNINHLGGLGNIN